MSRVQLSSYTLTTLALSVAVAGCSGKPEDSSAYTSAPAAEAPAVAQTASPLPPYPAWAVPMIGKPLKAVSNGTVSCAGAADVVRMKHTGARPGSELGGWGWDRQDAKPLDRVLLVDAGDKVVGAAVVGAVRTDVPKAIPEVKTPAVGWQGVAGVTSGVVRAVGLNAGGAACVIGRISI